MRICIRIMFCMLGLFLSLLFFLGIFGTSEEIQTYMIITHILGQSSFQIAICLCHTKWVLLKIDGWLCYTLFQSRKYLEEQHQHQHQQQKQHGLEMRHPPESSFGLELDSKVRKRNRNGSAINNNNNNNKNNNTHDHELELDNISNVVHNIPRGLSSELLLIFMESEETLNAFTMHLNKEFSLEILFAFIEVMQFQQYLVRNIDNLLTTPTTDIILLKPINSNNIININSNNNNNNNNNNNSNSNNNNATIVVLFGDDAGEEKKESENTLANNMAVFFFFVWEFGTKYKSFFFRTFLTKYRTLKKKQHLKKSTALGMSSICHQNFC